MSVSTTSRLTDRQLQCLRLSATMTDKDISRHLGISHYTVSLHVREAMRRLDVQSRKAALRKLAEDPLYDPPAIPERPFRTLSWRSWAGSPATGVM